MIENDALAVLRLARDAKEAVSDYGEAIKQVAAEVEEQESAAAQNPAALAARSHALQIADMIRALREDRTPPVDGYAGRKPVEISVSSYESARTYTDVTRLRDGCQLS